MLAVFGDPHITAGSLYRPMKVKRDVRTGRLEQEDPILLLKMFRVSYQVFHRNMEESLSMEQNCYMHSVRQPYQRLPSLQGNLTEVHTVFYHQNR